MSTSDKQPCAGDRRSSDYGQLISNLPPELFVQVLDWVYRLLRRIGITWDTNWTVPYQLVCRRWRDVVCSTPQFWQEITINSSPKWLDFCLTRCAGAPAIVDVFHPTCPEAIFTTLARHASIIRAFRVHCDVACLYDLEGLPSLLATPMPALEVLLLHGPYYESEILDVPLTHDLVPRLTSLELWNCIAPRDVAVYTPLRYLTFLGTKWAGSYDEFLDVLCNCQALEYLRLDEELLDSFAEKLASPPIDTRRRTTPPNLDLPHVKTVELSGQRGALFHLLATIHMPQATAVELTNCDDDDESGPLITRLLAPNPQLRIPFFSSLRTVSLSCWDGDPFNVSLHGGPDGNARFSVDYGMVHNELWPGNSYLEHNLVALMNIFSVASVHTLEVQGRLDEVAVETWHRVFQTFSSLRTLRVKGRGTLDTLWLGLSRGTVSSLEHDGAVCCPSLSEICVDDLPWVALRFKFAATAQLLETVRGVLSARVRAGCMRVKKLQLYLEYTDELWDQTCELREGFVEDVKALVGELDYRDRRA
ncbi:hypothetical protein GSI_05917 [Ganoderma sinense ZZ0214-1]|uniref:Uncharacterized protein n=1 Tax=Ganoderma sinense ZZ0214-1 TaxID=1077348 RepID=A0A2G8SBT6_9APHY|nr:hypothetical protein GSI_05917 [Ganoderma sinense ZZ0214-1]